MMAPLPHDHACKHKQGLDLKDFCATDLRSPCYFTLWLNGWICGYPDMQDATGNGGFPLEFRRSWKNT